MSISVLQPLAPLDVTAKRTERQDAKHRDSSSELAQRRVHKECTTRILSRACSFPAFSLTKMDTRWVSFFAGGEGEIRTLNFPLFYKRFPSFDSTLTARAVKILSIVAFLAFVLCLQKERAGAGICPCASPSLFFLHFRFGCVLRLCSFSLLCRSRGTPLAGRQAPVHCVRGACNRVFREQKSRGKRLYFFRGSDAAKKISTGKSAPLTFAPLPFVLCLCPSGGGCLMLPSWRNGGARVPSGVTGIDNRKPGGQSVLRIFSRTPCFCSYSFALSQQSEWQRAQKRIT